MGMGAGNIAMNVNEIVSMISICWSIKLPQNENKMRNPCLALRNQHANAGSHHGNAFSRSKSSWPTSSIRLGTCQAVNRLSTQPKDPSLLIPISMTTVGLCGASDLKFEDSNWRRPAYNQLANVTTPV